MGPSATHLSAGEELERAAMERLRVSVHGSSGGGGTSLNSVGTPLGEQTPVGLQAPAHLSTTVEQMRCVIVSHSAVSAVSAVVVVVVVAVVVMMQANPPPLFPMQFPLKRTHNTHSTTTASTQTRAVLQQTLAGRRRFPLGRGLQEPGAED